MDRRRFLQTAGLTLGTGLTGCAAAGPGRAAHLTAAAPIVADLSRWEEVRTQFNLTRDVVYLGGFFLASHPTPVRDAITAHREALDANPFGYVEDNVGRFERAARESLAAHLGAQPDDFAMTDSATMGLGLVYGGLRLRPEQEVLTSVHDHPSTAYALRYRAEHGDRERAPTPTVRTITLYDNGASAAVTTQAIVGRVTEAIRPETRVLALTWVHSTTGVKLPIAAIADALVPINAGRAPADRVLLSVDGVHGFGVEDVTIADLRCDVFIASCHKWLFGPRGTGFVWANTAGWSAVVPTIATMETMWRGKPREQLPIPAQMTPGGFHSFEHRWALPAAVDFHMRVGKRRIAARIHELNRQCKEGLAAMRHVKLHTPRGDELSAGIISFDVAGLAPKDVALRLKERRIIASESPYPTFRCARVSPGVLNTPEEIDRALREIRALA